jgi:hypothetical protein
MSTRGAHPNTLESELVDIKRRLKTLETSPRVPGLTVIGTGGLSGPTAYLGNPVTVNTGGTYSTLTGLLPAYNVPVGGIGQARLLILFGGYVTINTAAAIASNGGIAFSVGLTGANAVDVNTVPQRAVLASQPGSGSAGVTTASVATSLLLTDMAPGDTTVQLHVRSDYNSGATGLISNYWLQVLSL